MTKNQSCASCSGLFHRTQILKRRTYQICKPCDTKIKALGHDVPWFPQTFLPRDFTGVPHVSDITSQLFEAELTPAQLHDYLENIWWDYAMRRDQPSDPMTIKMQLSVPMPNVRQHRPQSPPRTPMMAPPETPTGGSRRKGESRSSNKGVYASLLI